MRADLERPEFNAPPALAISRMTAADLRAVLRIELLSFSTQWPSSAFASEISDNKLARYYVGRMPDLRTGADEIVAYGGIWVVLEDSHVTTIAVHPSRRGQRLGERLFVHLLREAIIGGASWMTLEVRRTNTVAQNLYKKYGFTVVSTRRAYYSDNGEDAYVMWAGNLRGELYEARLNVLERELSTGSNAAAD
ncbi:MAG: ribosomal protein S18-alanine N-acetyltransferase [Vulcanimicrobiaceae bacterium]